MLKCADWLSSIIDNYEARPDSNGRAKRIDKRDFEDSNEVEKLKSAIAQLISEGAFKANFGRHARRTEIESVTLQDAGPIYRMLGRTPSAELARESMVALRHEAEWWETNVLNEIESAWAKNKRWQNIDRSNAAQIVPIQMLARALKAGKHTGQDMRSFSAKEAGDSKLMETRPKLLAAYMFAGESEPLEKLERLINDEGARKIPLPITLSGPLSLGNMPIGSELDYFAIPFHQLDDLTIRDDIEYVLTIENMTSFHRHASEINQMPRKGLVLFTSGQPSTAFKTYYSRLVGHFGSTVPFFHWSDVDGGGLEITNSLRSLNPSLRLHLMDVELAEDNGVSAEPISLSNANYSGTVLEPLARFLSTNGAKILEQEKIDPAHPSLH